MTGKMLANRLRRMGYSLSKIAKETGTDRQTVWYVVHNKFESPRAGVDRVRERIKEILGGKE